MLVAVAVLAISLSFLIYRHPPSTWRPIQPPTGEPEPSAKFETSQSGTPAEVQAEAQIQTKGETTEPSPQTTPKAAPSGTHGGAAIPTFTLAEHESSEDEDDEDNLPPPSFPAMNSAQRTSALPAFVAPPPKPALMAPPPMRAPSSLMAPPPRIVPSNLRALPKPSQSMHVPTAGPLPNRSPLPNRGPPASNGSLGPPAAAGPSLKTPNARNRVLLSPGHSPLDWAHLQRSGKNLSGVSSLTRVTPAMLKHNNGRKGKPSWSSYQGKVYNITPYLPFHPGGEGELRRASGKDGGKLFMEVHPWVNWENMLGECLVGIMVTEEQTPADSNGSLEDMD
ncbi:hypothetical protein K505DRAFT_360114 [Melanomma pulvis-pyrius CBS 109.77]|uniref:Cytochrome b5 heme-binding domain-containing protein n=1 Tax=Melanomma pulvis-pyrius CBS 109.77 TaxID=1314802 RepID=A0A6A6XGZ3_9PLEO|nr:hypothetical protein K505DRAFT_360114 [Melanomma pulvis-pyrius CBS 109.77]